MKFLLSLMFVVFGMTANAATYSSGYKKTTYYKALNTTTATITAVLAYTCPAATLCRIQLLTSSHNSAITWTVQPFFRSVSYAPASVDTDFYTATLNQAAASTAYFFNTLTVATTNMSASSRLVDGMFTLYETEELRFTFTRSSNNGSNIEVKYAVIEETKL